MRQLNPCAAGLTVLCLHVASLAHAFTLCIHIMPRRVLPAAELWRNHAMYARVHADWIEHVLETGGVPYLHTPASKLNIFVRHSLDTYGFLLGCAGALLYLAWRLAALGSFLLAEKPKLA